MRTRMLTASAALVALAAGCGDESVPASDPGLPTPSTSSSSTPSTTPSSSPAAPDSDIGPAFRAFARGGDPPPMAAEVQVYLGNALTGVLTPRDAADRRAWATCTEVGTYAAATCPISPLTVVRRHDAVAYTAKPQGLCLATYGPLPAALRELDRTTIVARPDSIDSCMQNFAIQLFTDGDGRLVAVSRLLGEP